MLSNPGSVDSSPWPSNFGFICFLMASTLLSAYWGRTITDSFRGAMVHFDHTSTIISIENNETLTTDAPKRKPKRLFSFIFFGNDPLFVKGAIRNAQMIPLLMTDWRARFYIDGTVSDDVVAEIQRYGGETVRVNDEMAGWADVRRMWRYLILDDPDVEYAAFRDIDSRVSIREILSIRAWIDSGIPFHAMHDHPDHTTSILGGMWGAYVPAFQKLMNATESINRFVLGGENRGKWGDQTWLATYVFGQIRDQLLLHDAFLCNAYGVKSHPFPAARSDHGDYVGKIILENFGLNDPYYVFGSKRFNKTEAPLKCRLSPEYAFG